MKAKESPSGNVPETRAGVSEVYGLVLMGGQSTRMGQDKSALVYHGKPQRDHLTGLLLPLCEQVYWSVNEAQWNTLTYSKMLLDTYLEAGPLGGLLTAFGSNPDVAWLVVPCDLPRLNTGTLQGLLKNRNPATLATTYYNADRSGPEPLVSLWEPLAGPVLRTWFEAGNRSPRRFLSTHPSTLLNVPDARVFDNVNTWKEYEKVAVHRNSEQ